MTVSTNSNRISYNGDASTVVFSFPYKFLATSDLKVYVGGVLKTINVDYTVGTPTDAGANVTFSSAPAVGTGNIVILRDPDNLQSTALPNTGPLPSTSIEKMVDKLTLQVQRLKDLLTRSITLNDADAASTTTTLPLTAERANKVLSFDAAGQLITTQEIGVVRGNWAAATAYVARDIVKDTSNNNIYICLTAHTASGALPISGNADVAKWSLLVDAATATAAAASASASATSASGSASTATTKASEAAASAAASLASKNAAATSETNAAGSASTATTKASEASASASAALASQNAAAASEAAASAVIASGMYSAVQDKTGNYTVVVGDAGDLIRINSSGGAATVTLPAISGASITDGFKVAIVKWSGDANAVTVQRSSTDLINGSATYILDAQYKSATFVADKETNTWFAAGTGGGGTNVIVDTFSGNASTTAFTLSGDPGSKNNTAVYIGGVYQPKSQYSLSGTTLTFTAAPPLGTNNIEVVWSTPLAIGTPSDGTVTTAKIADANVTTAKIADGSITLAKLLSSIYGTSGANKLLQLDAAGKLPAIDGSQLTGISASGRLIGIQYFTTVGTATYTPTAGTNFVIVEVVGGGGGGMNNTVGNGGGGGGFARKKITSSFSGVTVTVGNGGAGGTTAASAGGTSSFGALVSATGGAGAASSSTAGGSGSSGDINVKGNCGNTNNGGSSFYGGGAQVNAAAGLYGGGGGSNSTASAGFAGGQGIVIVYEYA